MEVGSFGVVDDNYGSQMRKVLEAYEKEGKIAIMPSDDVKVAEILNTCCSCLEMVSVLFNKDLNQIVDRFSEAVKQGFQREQGINWDDVIV